MAEEKSGSLFGKNISSTLNTPPPQASPCVHRQQQEEVFDPLLNALMEDGLLLPGLSQLNSPLPSPLFLAASHPLNIQTIALSSPPPPPPPPLLRQPSAHSVGRPAQQKLEEVQEETKKSSTTTTKRKRPVGADGSSRSKSPRMKSPAQIVAVELESDQHLEELQQNASTMHSNPIFTSTMIMSQANQAASLAVTPIASATMTTTSMIAEFTMDPNLMNVLTVAKASSNIISSVNSGTSNPQSSSSSITIQLDQIPLEPPPAVPTQNLNLLSTTSCIQLSITEANEMANDSYDTLVSDYIRKILASENNNTNGTTNSNNILSLKELIYERVYKKLFLMRFSFLLKFRSQQQQNNSTSLSAMFSINLVQSCIFEALTFVGFV